MSQAEVVALLGAVRDERERRAIYLGIYAGLRSGELRGLQGRHFARRGIIEVAPDIAKGRKGRSIPVSRELAPIVADIRRRTAVDDFVLPSQRFRDPGVNRETADRRKYPMSAKALWDLVRRVGKRAGIAAPIHPHLMRHACAEQLVRQVGLREAQAILGHAGLATTEGYLGSLTVDELASAIVRFTFGAIAERTFYPPLGHLVNPVEAPAGIEPA